MFGFVCMNSPPLSTQFITSPRSWVASVSRIIDKTMAADECCVSGEAACYHCTIERHRGRCFHNVVTHWSGKQLPVRSWTSAFRRFVSFSHVFDALAPLHCLLCAGPKAQKTAYWNLGLSDLCTFKYQLKTFLSAKLYLAHILLESEPDLQVYIKNLWLLIKLLKISKRRAAWDNKKLCYCRETVQRATLKY